MSSKFRRVPLYVIVGALVVSGFRDGHAQPPAPPCTLLTQSQVGAVLGVSVGNGEPIGSTGCEWSGPGSPRATVTVTVWDAQAFAGMKTPLPGVTKAPVGGTGDDAVFATVGSLTTLSVKQGKVAFVVRVYGVQGQARQEAVEKSLAVDVLKRI
jgi:hypothetical protein